MVMRPMCPLPGGVKLINEVTKPLPVIEADAYRCTQLMYNLVANAVKLLEQSPSPLAELAGAQALLTKVHT